MIARWFTLGLPLRQPRVAWAATLFVLLYYAFTATPDLSFYDSAELALVARTLGLGHPIGQPVHTLLGYFASHLPLISPVRGLVWLSVLPAALAIIPTLSIADLLTIDNLDKKASVIVRAVVVVAYALTWTVWEPATRIEVYALATFFSLWALARVAAHRRGFLPRTQRAWLGSGILLGLVAATNAYLAVLTACALLPLLVGALRTKQLAVRELIAFTGGAFIGLLPYLYVPIVAHDTEAFVWGAPRGGRALLDYMRGADYAHNRGITASAFFDHLVRWLAWASSASVLPLGFLGAVSHATIGKDQSLGRSASSIFLLATVGLLCSHVVFAPDIADYVDYLAPALLLASAGTATLIGKAWTKPGQLVLAAPALALLVFVALIPRPALHERTRHRDHAASVLAHGALRDLPRNAVLIAAQDHWVAPLLYLQEAEHERRDVVLLAYGLASSSWYWDLLYRRHPDLPRIELRGQGGKIGRLQRLLAALADRPVYVAEPFVTRELGLNICDVSYVMRTASECTLPPGRHIAEQNRSDAATRALTEVMDSIDRGAPPSDSALAEVALARGEALLRLGRAGAALRATLAGIPPSMRVEMHFSDESAFVHVPRFTGEMPSWKEDAPLGDARRNLVFAAFILGQAGDEEDKARFMERARELGLPEASE